MGHQQLYWSHPRKFGQGSRSCRVCSNRHGLIRKYGLNMCRQCFRQYAKDIGFVKVSSVAHCYPSYNNTAPHSVGLRSHTGRLSTTHPSTHFI
uniref:Small ribosomal subunit protein uS14 n=1 Tax=Cyclopterus lumpus TaxID=8103 RepID=A0A8C3A628_CYCLU